MARRMAGGIAIAALVTSLLLPTAASEAQGGKDYRLRTPGSAIPLAPSVRNDGTRRRSAPMPFNQGLSQAGPKNAPPGQAGPGEVASSLRARGFDKVGPMQQRGNTLITEAVDPNGTRVQLVITPNGQIIGIRPLGPRSR